MAPPPLPKLSNGASAPGPERPLGPKRPIGLAKGPLPRNSSAIEPLPRFEPPGGWPDVTESLDEIDFYRSQGLDGEAQRAFVELRQRHPGHPGLARWLERSGPSSPASAFSAKPAAAAVSADKEPSPGSASESESAPVSEPMELSASARLHLDDLADQEIEAALEEFGPEDLRPIADFEERSPNITGHTVIARNPLLMAPPSTHAPAEEPLAFAPLLSGVTVGRRPLARTIVTSTLMPPRPYQGPGGERPQPAEVSESERPGTPMPIGTAVYGASRPGALPPSLPEFVDIPLEVEIEDSDELTEDSSLGDDAVEPGANTLVSRHLGPPASREAAPRPAQAVHIQVIGSRGHVLAAFNIAPGTSFAVGRVKGKPWFDDVHLLPTHAELVPAAGGGVSLTPLPQGGAVYRQLESAERLTHGDQIRVGQSTIFYESTGEGGRLHVQRNSRGPAEIMTLPAGGVVFGREYGDVVFSSDTYVSSEHCRVSSGPGGVVLEDLGSSNGTYLRVRASEQVPFGTLLLMGQTQFRVTAA